MKKIVSLLLVISIITTMGLNLFALENNTIIKDSSLEDFSSSYLLIHKEMVKSNTGNYPDDIVVKKLTDFSGNELELIETGKSGYYIFDPVSGQYIEFSPNAPSPYLNKFGELKYFGPKCYYVKDGKTFSHTIVEDQKNISEDKLFLLQQNFDVIISETRKNKDYSVLSLMNNSKIEKSVLTNRFSTMSYQDIYIPAPSYIWDAVYPPNLGASCGYVATCIVLNYWNQRKRNAGIIPSKFLDSKGQLKTSGYTLQDHLLSYGYGQSSTGWTICDVLNDYCDEFNISATASWGLGKIGANSELEEGRPVILFGWLPDVSGSGNVNHAVTAYGIRYGDYIKRYIVHYGWRGYEKVYLGEDTWIGGIGTNTRFVLN
ncbi:MAG: hypothetical protein GX270_06925 [Clostridiaceae bacterium]|nr:hypothetical protein [Clostridiaceae bacterium]